MFGTDVIGQVFKTSNSVLACKNVQFRKERSYIVSSGTKLLNLDSIQTWDGVVSNFRLSTPTDLKHNFHVYLTTRLDFFN